MAFGLVLLLAALFLGGAFYLSITLHLTYPQALAWLPLKLLYRIDDGSLAEHVD